MTQAEYRAGYKRAKSLSGNLLLKNHRELKKVFQEAAEVAAKEVQRATQAGLSDLTSSAWEQINLQLQAGADLISEATEESIPPMISKAYKNYLNVDETYVFDAIQQAGTNQITRAGFTNMGLAVDFRLLNIQATRLFTDGYTFSERVWNLFDSNGKPIGVNGDYQYRIRNLILTGQAQGRDVVDIADDIQAYVLKGKDYVFNPARYGQLIPGTGRYKARISKTVDWRALRIARSELNSSLQLAGIEEGVINPAATELYNWQKTAGNPIDEDGSRNASGKRCIDLQREGPYQKEDVPGYQHPNCGCTVIPVLMDQREFVSQLKDWVPGSGNNTELDKWYNQVYLPAQP